MATITPTVSLEGDHVVIFSYANMANGDAGVPIPSRFSEFSDRVAQVKGTFGTGGKASIEGSNDSGSTYAFLNDVTGTELSFTSAGIKQVLEVPALTRPRITAGDASTSLTVVITCRRPAK